MALARQNSMMQFVTIIYCKVEYNSGVTEILVCSVAILTGFVTTN